jgi:hypothetical protein
MNFFKLKNNNKLLLVIGLVVFVGLVVLYYLSIRTQPTTDENFTSTNYMSSEEVKDLINNNNNFVLVFHKMENCGHCITFTPIWKKFASKCNELFPGKKTVKCVMVDPSNELSADVEGFPTIRYYKSVNDYVDFENERTVKGLTKFVKDNM